MTTSIYMPISSEIPSEYYFENNYQAQDKTTNIYSARTRDINLSFKEEQILKKILDDLTPKDKNGRSIPFARLSDDKCRDILEKIISRVSEKCRAKLNQAGFEMVSNWSVYSNARAKGKLCALMEFLDNNTTIAFPQFSTRELRAIYRALKSKENEISATTKNGDNITKEITLDEDVLTVKQTFLFDVPLISIHYEGCPPPA